MTAVMDGWQAEAVDLAKQGLDAYAIGEQVGKSPPTIRKALKRARDAGILEDPMRDRVLTPEEAARLAGAAEDGEVPPEDDPEYEPPGEGDPLDTFREEAGEAVGPMPPSRAVDPQDGLFDKVWEDENLEAALEGREETREAKLAATKAHKVKDDAVKALLDGYSLAVGEVARIGRFRIKKTKTEGNEVSFTTEPREQLRIGVEKDS